MKDCFSAGSDDFQVERVWTPAGEGVSQVADGKYLLSMSDSRTNFIEWGPAGGRERKKARVFTGDVWVVPPGQVWWTRREVGKYCIQLTLSDAWLRRTTDSSAPLAPHALLRDSLVTGLLRTLAESARNHPASPETVMYQESLGAAVVLHIATHYGRASEAALHPGDAAPLSSGRLRAVADYVSNHLAETITLPDLAQVTGLSTSRFSRRFRITTGQTPHQFVTALRVERARELIDTRRFTLAEVAALTGFADQSHLTRHIRRHFGLTPGALQRLPSSH